ncbi:hypothetical protein [Halobacillus litoralis]|uniref:hypothetical protein n=1 Tax=Halobacillus litoralis TaxID=45668 RepID=UPI0013714A1C|nr:hypothetical protein [Halobacillus litoralis]MYL39916.1 hypothetical protein [Halobacillus litoralis]
MNDLTDRKLRKMNHRVKYDHVPFDERYMKKNVIQSMHKGSPRPKSGSWMRKKLWVPAFVTAAAFTVTWNADHPASDEAGRMAYKSISSHVKTYGGASGADMAHTPSPIVRETYIIYEDKEFHQTSTRVSKEQLGEVVGVIGHQSPGEEAEPLTRVNNFQPEAKIYTIKGEKHTDKVAVQSWRSTSIGPASLSRQGYFVFEKHPSGSSDS